MKFSNLLPDLPFPQPVIVKTFQQLHEQNLERFPEWSLLATRRKLVAAYWLAIISNHFFLLMVLGSLPVLLLSNQPLNSFLVALIPTAAVVFSLLFFTMYWPHYYIEFLPHLDSCLESYTAQRLEGIQQCKKEQHSVVTLMLIQQTYQQLAGMETGLINAHISKLLARQYGVSVKSITPALQLIVRGDWDRKSIRKRTEILNDFEDAREYFRQLSCDKGLFLLNALQHKILQQPSK